MKRLLAILTAVGLLLIPWSANVHAAPSSSSPPIGQPLVREGDFAVELANSFGLATKADEAAAESALSSLGIIPRNGWIADYPITPDILAEIQDSAQQAAGSGQLGMSGDQAVARVKSVSAALGLPIVVAAGESGGLDRVPPREDYYGESADLQGYYYDTGPPVVTYYPPPLDYGDMYSYVPSPFWWDGIGFGGFFVLNDFNVVVVDKHHRHHHKGLKTVTNHVKNPDGHVTKVNAAARAGKDRGNVTRAAVRGPGAGAGLRTGNGQRGAGSAVTRDLDRGRRGGTAANRDMDRSGIGGGTTRGGSSGRSSAGGPSSFGAAPSRQSMPSQGFNSQRSSGGGSGFQGATGGGGRSFGGGGSGGSFGGGGRSFGGGGSGGGGRSFGGGG
ncbi:MAG: hypothetical protein WAW37_11690, partial [Syntrophobacteraceae bacterium]